MNVVFFVVIAFGSRISDGKHIRRRHHQSGSGDASG